MIECIGVFSFLGFAFGILFDFFTSFEKALNVKWFTFALDLLMTVAASVVFGCAMIAYSNGNFKGINFFFTLVVFVIYMTTLHKVVYPIFCGVFYPMRKILKKIAKKLKNDEKSLKKLLHLGN